MQNRGPDSAHSSPHPNPNLRVKSIKKVNRGRVAAQLRAEPRMPPTVERWPEEEETVGEKGRKPSTGCEKQERVGLVYPREEKWG